MMDRATPTGRVLGSVVFLLTTAAMTAYIMTADSDHNEHMYVAASVKMQDRQIYKEYAYVQMPYLPILYSFLYKTSRTDHLLFAARATTCVLWAVSAFAILAAARVVSGTRHVHGRTSSSSPRTRSCSG